MTLRAQPVPVTAAEVFSKVPEVTAFFWIIKVLCTTVGETAADYLNTTLKVGLTNTSLLMGALLIVALVWQFRLPRYVPGVYWICVVLISVVGTLITDNLTDHFGVPLAVSTAVFATLLGLAFLGWYRSERTLSIHSIFTAQREGWYWLTVLFTFALGTAAGDLFAEQLNLGYWPSALIFAGLIALTTLAHRFLRLGSVVAFWIAYILTRPLGASIGDFLSQDKDAGGLGLGTTITSLIFLVAILAVIVYLTATKRDLIRSADEKRAA